MKYNATLHLWKFGFEQAALMANTTCYIDEDDIVWTGSTHVLCDVKSIKPAGLTTAVHGYHPHLEILHHLGLGKGPYKCREFGFVCDLERAV